MKIIAVNGGPRKNWNTAKLLDRAIEGAQSVGAEVEKFHLYDYAFKGCTSCFLCKQRDSHTLGKCAYQDELQPILQAIREANGLLVASPIYYIGVTGETRCFLERLIYQNLTYDKDQTTLFKGKVDFALIYTMGMPVKLAANYTNLFEKWVKFLGIMNGTGEYMIEANTYQFDDYGKYVTSALDVARKAKSRDENFPKALENAYGMGVRLAKKG